jgi:hypothetical protein
VSGCAARAGEATIRAPGPGLVRVDQVGYPAAQPKIARLLSPVAVARAPFRVLDGAGSTVMRGRTGPDLGRWSRRFGHVYRLDLSGLRTAGSYTVEVTGAHPAHSPPFRVGAASDLYSPLLADVVRFVASRRDGPDVDRAILGRRPSHLTDAAALTYATPVYRGTRLLGPPRRIGGPVDVSGGWMDAGDTLKFAGTSSFTELMILTALERYPRSFTGALPVARAEARFGLQWLLKLWDPGHARLVYQVGLGDGDGHRILGAHDIPWRLPEADDRLKGTSASPEHYVKYRPAFVMGPRISPNVAGRVAAALALGAKFFAGDRSLASRSLDAARAIYAHAATRNVGPLVASAPRGFYPEVEWRDDMELGAVAISDAENALGVAGAGTYLQAATRWADSYATSRRNGTDTLNLYDVAALAHDRLARALADRGTPPRAPVSRASLARDLADQVRLATAHARGDPFSLAWGYRDDDVVAHALGMTIEARVASVLGQDGAQATTSASTLARAQRDFVMGDNAWGTSFIVAAGSVYPHCLHDPIANLDGSLDGHGAILRGAVVPGPVDPRDLRGLALTRGARACPPAGGDGFARYSGHGGRYADRTVASASVEPSIDLAGLAILAFAQEAAG